MGIRAVFLRVVIGHRCSATIRVFVRWWKFVLVVAAGQEQLSFSIGRTLPTCSTCTGEDKFTSHYRGLRESLLDYCSKLAHKPVPLLFGPSDCSCVMPSSPRRLLTFCTLHTSLSNTPPHHKALKQPPMCHQTPQPLPSQQTVTT